MLNDFIEHVPGGLPTFQPPPFTVTANNVTYSFLDMTSQLNSAIIVLPLLSILENISLAKVFCEWSINYIYIEFSIGQGLNKEN